jgi:phosphopantothenoylcysteine decarboxylase/phosphopantothenate--cysteine ligase
MRAGHVVRVCLTDSAQKFVTAALFEGLTGQPCLVDTFEEPVRGRMAHIDLARWANLLIVAPATANTLAKMAHGEGEDMLTTLAIAFEGPILLAPAMNPAMYTQASTRRAMQALTARGAIFVEPTEGDVACGENGQGKLAPISQIVSSAQTLLHRSSLLEGQTVLITSGPTHEPIDQVRFVTNRSSGKMGLALAQAAVLMGATVRVVSGPTSVVFPNQVLVTHVKTAQEMLHAASTAAEGAHWIIGAAAVADYRPAEPFAGKLRRKEAEISLAMVQNPDIIATLVSENPGAKVVGFAAEPTAETETAQAKLERKGLFAVVANDVSGVGVGFESDDNAIVLLTRSGKRGESGKMSKLGCAIWLFEQLSDLLGT